jgi:hypothetical protein
MKIRKNSLPRLRRHRQHRHQARHQPDSRRRIRLPAQFRTRRPPHLRLQPHAVPPQSIRRHNGARIVKDRLFIFGDYQGFRQSTPLSVDFASVPTALMREETSRSR